MPFSVLLQGYPRNDLPMEQAQGPALQGMFLHLIKEVEPAVAERLHNDEKYRPYTLSPLSVGRTQAGTHAVHFQDFHPIRETVLRHDTSCYFRVTLLEDDLFPTFSRYFLDRSDPVFRLSSTLFVVTGVVQNPVPQTASFAFEWSQYVSYAELLNRASQRERKISLHFLTPTSFRRGKVDFPLPDPRLVFGSYRRRFAEFYQVGFLPDFDEQVEFHTGIASLNRLETQLVQVKKSPLVGFTGKVTYLLDRNAAPELIFQMNLLAEYAFFCGTGMKTTVGMGQTRRSA